MIVAVKMETQGVPVLTGSILGRVDGVQCAGFLFFTTVLSF